MDINASLIVQMLVFIVFVGLTMKYIWPPLINALDMRRKTIADGLAAAEQGQKTLELAEIKSKEFLIGAKAQAARIIEQANQRASHIIEESKDKAREEGERLLKLTQSEIEQQYHTARAVLRSQIGEIAIAGAEKILQREIDKTNHDHDRLIEALIEEI